MSVVLVAPDLSSAKSVMVRFTWKRSSLEAPFVPFAAIVLFLIVFLNVVDKLILILECDLPS